MARRAARAPGGVAVLPLPASVTVHSLDVVGLDRDLVTLRLTCSAGFYVRALAQDLGDQLGTGAHLAGLRRTRSAEFTLSQAVSLETVERSRAAAANAIVPLGAVLPAMSSAALSRAGVERASHGRDLGPDDLLGELTAASLADGGERLVRLLDERGELVAIARVNAQGALHPFVVLV
jgi:tRNA pseudouridine55 synthase